MDDIVYERWLPIPGYEGFYEVSDRGNVRSYRSSNSRTPQRRLTAPVPLHQITTPDGYRVVRLYRDGRRCNCRVHVLVLLSFVGPRPPGNYGAHRDGDPGHNWLGNLRWATPKENCRDRDRHGRTAKGEGNNRAKLTTEQVILIREAKGPAHQVARRFDVSAQTVYLIRRKRIWKHV